jgi:hypothetical protein
MGVAAVALPLGVMSTVVGTGAAFAAAKNQPGTLNCTSVTGTVTFNPPLTFTAQAVTTTIKATVKNCTPSGGGLKPKSGTATSTMNTANDDCTTLAGGSTNPQTLKTKWAPATKIKPTTLTFGGFVPATQPVTNDEGFSLPNSLGQPTTGTGSYLGTDTGATSTATVYSNKTAAQVSSLCSGAGLATLTLAAGTVHLG